MHISANRGTPWNFMRDAITLDDYFVLGDRSGHSPMTFGCSLLCTLKHSMHRRCNVSGRHYWQWHEHKSAAAAVPEPKHDIIGNSTGHSNKIASEFISPFPSTSTFCHRDRVGSESRWAHRWASWPTEHGPTATLQDAAAAKHVGTAQLKWFTIVDQNHSRSSHIHP